MKSKKKLNNDVDYFISEAIDYFLATDFFIQQTHDEEEKEYIINKMKKISSEYVAKFNKQVK